MLLLLLRAAPVCARWLAGGHGHAVDHQSTQWTNSVASGKVWGSSPDVLARP
ncbi:hypothetical protein VFPFJ_09484 [Purpureocillium lilacinum]|uniref:Uncharacterized protein n=1 Tax=Purpureocillium lilacinum TaxID=33203 RepID=A0A179GV59_PURLI|nr:hypothetical protein VFPFJ_09484 [Purpureocillium lilacinum]OAQ81029.1 hypothetical protein VFPFJ_09484 [Purpureocillium lilacinum]